MQIGFHTRITLFTLTLFVSVASLAQTIQVDGYTAIVGDRVITGGDIRKLTSPMLERAQRSLSGEALQQAQQQIYNSGLKRLINEALVLQAFEASGGIIPESAVRERVDSIIREKFNDNRAELLQTLRDAGESEQLWLERLREQLTVQFMTQEMVSGKVSVSPQELRTRYEAQIEDYTNEELGHLQIITKIVPENATNRFEELKTLYGIELDLREGSDFGDLAKKYSDDENADKGGEFGWLKSTGLRSALREGIQGLNKGEISKVISDGDRHYIAKLLGIREGGPRPIEEVQDSIQQEILEKKKDQRYTEWMAKLLKATPVILFEPDGTEVKQEE